MTATSSRSRRPSSLAEDSLAYTLARSAEILAAVFHGRNLDRALAAAALPAERRPAVLDVCYGTLRDHGRGDCLLAALLDKPLKDVRIRGLLLAALYLLERRSDNDHTVVDQAVTAAGVLSEGRLRGLANGVLRNFLRRRDELLAKADADPVASGRHPAWWLDLLRQAYPGQWAEVAAAGNSHPPMALRVNLRRGTLDDYRERLAAAGLEARAVGAVGAEGETGLLLARPAAVDRLSGFFDGLVSVQDLGAQRAAPLLDAAPGMRVLDACAAPGGKTAHLLERCAGLDLLALDAEPARAARIGENFARLGLAARVRAADCRRVEDWWDGRPFDRILADVPCSASGVVRRHPDAKWLRQPRDVAGFATTQKEILDALWPLLVPGGKMLYCTCSVFPAENEMQMRAFLARHADAAAQPLTPDEAIGLQLLPNADHDGFYYALLRKART